MSHGGRRSKRFHPPTVREAKKAYENYGIITAYHGGASRYCTVQAYTPEDNSCVELKHVRMKGSITNPKCKQRIVVGSCVLLEYGEIALIYKENHLIPKNILDKLERTVGAATSTARGMAQSEDEYSSESDDSDEYEEEGGASPVTAPVNHDPDCI
jgi:hypothetical protein